MNRWMFLLAALVIVAPLHAAPVSEAVAAEAVAMSEGVVRRIDAANGRITLKHGPLANLDMPPMTMVFRLSSPALLDALEVGDTVRFRAERIDGAYVVTAIEAVR